MFKIIDGQVLAEKIKNIIVQEIAKLGDARPNLAIILVGERADSELYVKLKEKEAKKVGIDTHLYKCPENISEQELLEIIKYLNEDKLIDAVLVQLPLPNNINTDVVMMSLDQNKDVDGFHPKNLEKILNNCDFDYLMPPVYAVVLEMLNSIDYKIKNKKVCIISNADIFSHYLSHILKCQGAEVMAIKADEKDLVKKTKQADVLITAIGNPKFIKKEMVKKHAIIIDIGITKQDNKIIGDVDFEDVKDVVDYITPVPGGVGPMTIAMALKNTLELYKQNRN
ncbi:MAG: bifunctional 5,10-methylenetetrahydrofolate dehydrogenase/5,10-methenyltetrahydrofolate cyclohydrolase [bacterium]|nr:bifunctional 5,10-methylenetetrahydrofolate dehydrogenase/5,10-methenyltetrahydrofolate cyclohydrolase [bacterium]